MPPLITNWHLRDVQWSKYRSENIKSNVYHLRRSKFSAYSLAFLIAFPLEPLGATIVKRMEISLDKEKGKYSLKLADFPNARFDATDMYGTFIFVITAAIAMALLFELAYHFDLFWPERVESRCMQWIWKSLAVSLTTAHGAASVASTHVVARQGVKITGVGSDEANAIRAAWDQRAPLAYKDESYAVTCVILGWVSFSFASYSALLMFRSYRHNNQYGPFTDGARRQAQRRIMDDMQLVHV